jgi:hypothetical protein
MTQPGQTAAKFSPVPTKENLKNEQKIFHSEKKTSTAKK